MARKMKESKRIIEAGRFVLPSPREVIMAKTKRGAWTAKQLAEWGVAWPPRGGWREELRNRWYAAHPEEIEKERARMERDEQAMRSRAFEPIPYEAAEPAGDSHLNFASC
jgi:hypothetical protein